MAAAGGVHILGAGSIGLVFGEALVSRGIPCTLLLRSQSKLAALSAFGGAVTVDRPSVLSGSTNSSSSSSSYQVAGEVAGCSSPGLAGKQQQQQQQQQHGAPIKRLLVTTKATDAVPALAAVKHRLSQDCVVLLLTNGVLGVYMDAVRTLFPPGGEAAATAPSFLLGMTTHGAYRTGDFSVMHCGQGSFVAGQPCQQLVAAAAAEAASQASSSSASSASTSTGLQDQQQQESAAGTAGAVEQQQQQQRRQHNIQAMLSLLGSLHQLQPDTSCTPDQLQQQLLLKLLINCCSNPLSGLLHCRNGGLPGNPHAEAVWRHIIAECKAVFGDQLPGSEQELFERVSHVVELNSQNYNSMLQDVMRRGPTEIEYLNGFVVRQGAAAGVATPYNEMLAQLMRARTAVPHALLTNESL